MEVVRLGEYNNEDPTYLPDRLIEGYTSMIWTERYLVPGEFQLKTPYVDETYDALPELTLISHRHTREVMIVESHLISEDADGNEELTVVGRSVDCMLESRYVEALYQKKRQMVKEYYNVDAALVLLWNSVANISGYDVTRPRKDADPDDEQYHDGDRWAWTDKDALPNVGVSDSTPYVFSPTTKRWWLREGLMYEQFIKILDQGDLGIRTIRPPIPLDSESQFVTVQSTTAGGGFGDVERTSWANRNRMRFDIFNGVDRTIDQDENTKVIFDVLRDDFINSSHLWSARDWKTGVEVISSLNRKKDVYRSGQSGYSGWLRRTMTFDAGAPELPDKPDYPGKNASEEEQTKYEERLARWKNRRDSVYDQFEEDYEADALRELNKLKRIRLFSGDVSTETPYVFNKDYGLGDRVSLRGRRGLDSIALVDEYVRTDDAEGDRGYPGLTIL